MEAIKLKRYRRLTLIIPLAAGVLLVTLAFFYYRYESRRAENEYYDDLRAVGRLKTTQLENWYHERSNDAGYYSTAATLLDELESFTTTGYLNRRKLLRFFAPTIKNKMYEEILVTDLNGNIIFSVDRGYSLKPHVISDALVYTINSRKVSTANLYYCEYHQKVHNDIMAPLIINKELKGILIMRVNPDDFLFPYIQEWPVSSRTAETILAARDGDSVVFLNEMKKVTNTALRHKLPLTDNFVPAVAAVKGRTGRFAGRDYKGDPVLSDLSHIPGTNWSLVVKIDKSEINDEVVYRSFLFTALMILTIVTITGALVLGYRRRQEIYLRLKDNEDHARFSAELNLLVDVRTRELQKMHEDLLNFTHIISHDLKEPVRKVKFLTSLVNEVSADGDTTKAKSYLNRLEVSADRLRELIYGIENYIDVQDTQLHSTKVDLNKCIKSIINNLDLLIESKGAKVTVKELPLVEGVGILLYKLFYNLLENSLKFSRAGVPPVIEIDYRNITQNGKEYVEITVTDNGLGFEEKYAARIFEPFKRLHSKDTYEGAGLGLTICRKIAERHNGHIFATSHSNEGAVIHVVLPVN